MKRILIRLLAIMICWLIVFGEEPAQLSAQELSLIAPDAATQAEPDAARAYLGVTFEPEVRNAAVAQSITPGSPAEQAGLRPGDAIEALNGRRVATYQDVLEAIRWMEPGDLVEMSISRRISIRTHAVLERASNEAPRRVNASISRTPAESEWVQPAVAEEPLPAPLVLPNRVAPQTRQFNTNPREPITYRNYRANQDVNRPENDRASQRNNEDRGSRRWGLFRRRN
jgi:hypothetical protein